MNEAYEVELKNLTASFLPSPFDLVLGVEKQSTSRVEDGDIQGVSFTDVEWQVIYCRVLVDDRWWFLPQAWYDELDEQYSEMIGDKLWLLTNTIT